MHNITINGNKRAIISHMRQTYQNENNADVLRFMMVPEFNGLSIKDDCLVMWTISNEDESLIIDTGQITWKDELIDGYLVSEILINSTVTQVPGELKIRIKILSTNNNMVAKTNPCSFSVEKHPDSAETLPEGSLTLLNQWQIDMTNLRDEMTVSLTEIRQISDDVSDAKTEVNENLIMVKDLKQVVSEKHTEVIDSADRVYNALDETNQSKEAAQQALQDLLAMLGSDVATLVNGKIPMSQIPATATQEIYTVTSEEELTSLSAQRGDLAELIEEVEGVRTITKTWQCLGDATVLENWVVWGTSYAVQAGNANTATNAVNASMINNHRVVTMSATDFDTAVKDENTVYLVGEFS